MEGRLYLPVAVALVLAACAPQDLPPYGGVLVVVDTDLDAPRLVSRFRVDVYAEDGTWLDSRDVVRRDRGDWPVSFSVFSEAAGTRAVRVRLRAYADGKERDYRGERYEPLAPLDAPPSWVAGQTAVVDDRRLVRQGVDVTPPTEPRPETAIDRLVRVPVTDGVRGTVRVVLRGVCAGTMADLANDRTCVDTESTLVSVEKSPIDPDLTLPTTTRSGTFGRVDPPTRAPRPTSPLHDEEVAVVGGAFFLGETSDYGTSVLVGQEVSTHPERLVVVQSLLVDRYEVSVARWRAALARGFAPPVAPRENDGPLPTESGTAEELQFCTYSRKPLGREEYPINCVSYESARAFCKFFGGDLPTETQWEYVAAISGRATETDYAWGASDPDCAGMIYARFDSTDQGDQFCVLSGQPFGVQPVTSGPLDETPSGVHGLGGNVSEIARGTFRPYGSACWRRSSLFDAGCDDATAPYRVARGGQWVGFNLRAVERSPIEESGYVNLGFRCVRKGDP